MALAEDWIQSNPSPLLPRSQPLCSLNSILKEIKDYSRPPQYICVHKSCLCVFFFTATLEMKETVKVCELCTHETLGLILLQSSNPTLTSLGRRGQRWCQCEESRWGWSLTGLLLWRRLSNAGEPSPRKPLASPAWTQQGSPSMCSHMVTTHLVLTHSCPPELQLDKCFASSRI